MKLKTTEEIKKESLKLMSKALHLDELHDKREIAEIRERIRLRDNCILYLQTNPSAEYVNGVKERLKLRIKEIKAEEFHTAKKDLPTLEYQLKIQSYILD